MIKKLLFSAILVCLALSCRAQYPVGVSLGLYKENLTESNINEVRDAGIRYVEVVTTPFVRKFPMEEFAPRMEQIRVWIENAGLEVWSVHLPYGKGWDISITDETARQKVVKKMCKSIDVAASFKPCRLILHPSADKIEDADRQARLEAARKSIGEIAAYVQGTGMVICVEDLPRACLGRESSEIEYLISPYPDVMVCFDSNHLLKESHESFFKALGPRIKTIHASDYDRVDERHWPLGKGVVDWPAFMEGLRSNGYDGVFMHEVRGSEDITPATIREDYERIF